MNKESDESAFLVIERVADGEIVIEGELDETSQESFENMINALAPDGSREVTLNLRGLDIEDGVALATAINSLRRLRARCGRIILKGAPQMLCHNLYRVGLLDGNSIELVDMRLDEPSGI